MIKPITRFMQKNTAFCIPGPVKKIQDVTLKERFFFNDQNEIIAQSTSYQITKGGHRLIKTILNTAEGLVKITEQNQNIIKLKSHKGKNNFKFPYSISSSVIYNENGPVKRKMFLIKDGVDFLHGDKDNFLIYKKLRNFKTQHLTAHTPVNTDDFIFDSSRVF